MDKKTIQALPEGPLHAMRMFYQAEKNQEIITTEAALSAVLWEKIFFHFFGESPQDLVPPPKRYRPGSTDPRWDTLLHSWQGLRIQAQVAQEHALRTMEAA